MLHFSCILAIKGTNVGIVGNFGPGTVFEYKPHFASEHTFAVGPRYNTDDRKDTFFYFFNFNFLFTSFLTVDSAQNLITVS